MGTRNLTAVILNGKPVIAQYGQWDGYPEGQGATVIEFVKKHSVDEMKKSFGKCSLLDPDRIEVYFGHKPSEKEYDSVYDNRNIGAEILENVFNDERGSIVLLDSMNFIKESLFCEFAYIINLDTEKLEFYTGFQKTPPVNSRYYSESDVPYDAAGGTKYYPCEMRAEYDLSGVGDETLEDMKRLDENRGGEEEQDIPKF